MDTFVDSSWYFMRYCDPQLDDAMVGAGTRYWMPMDQYIGGIEHAILHLLYARFWTKVMRDLKLVEIDEPFTHLLTQGMVLNEAFVRSPEQGGKRVFLGRRARHRARRARCTSSPRPPRPTACRSRARAGRRCPSPRTTASTRRTLIDRYGADTARLFVMFASPPEQTLEWNDAGVEGAHRFLQPGLGVRQPLRVDDPRGRRASTAGSPRMQPRAAPRDA